MEDRDRTPLSWTRTDTALAMISLVWSVAPIVLMAAHWLAAWAVLGHRPRPWVDDPGQIGGAVNILGFLTAFSILHLPAVLLWFPAYWLVRHRKTRLGKVMALATLLLPLSSVFILRADPLGIVTWWFD